MLEEEKKLVEEDVDTQPTSQPSEEANNMVDEPNQEEMQDEQPMRDEQTTSLAQDVNEANQIEEEIEPEIEKMFTQDQLNEIVGKTRMEARDKAVRDFYERYGVDNDDDLNAIFGRGQQYDILDESYNNANNELAAVKAENALLKSNINPDRFEDVMLILRGKGMEVSVENIVRELMTHPEWKNNESTTNESTIINPQDKLPNDPNKSSDIEGLGEVQTQKPATLKKFGFNTTKAEDAEESEEQKAMKMFGL